MCEDCKKMNRRRFIASGVIGVGIGSIAGTRGFGMLDPASAGTLPDLMPAHIPAPQGPMGPDAALERLMQGNARYVSAPDLCERQLIETRGEVAKGQHPWATVLSCADSRVTPELVFGGVGIGELFVCRNAGNTADPVTLGTIEYGAEHLHVPLIVVLGHEKCGAVTAAVDVAKNGTQLPGSLGPMVAPILPAARETAGQDGDAVMNAVRANARLTADGIVARSEIIRHLIETGKTKVVHATYMLESGKVEFAA